jgi:hypothetical protein
MRYVLALCAVLAALTFMAASAAMNWVFLSSLGKSHLESQIFGAVSVAVDVLKSLLPIFIAGALAAQKRIYAAVAAVAFCLFFAFSLISAIGFAAHSRGAVTGGKEVIALRYQAAVRDVAEVEGKLKALPKARPQAVVVEALRALEQDKKFTTSKGCTEATALDSRSYCDGYFTAKAELATALEVLRLDGRLSTLKTEVARLQDVGAAQESDVQATLLSRMTGLDVSGAQMALVIFVAVLVEIGAAFGFYLAWGWMPQTADASPRRSVKPVREIFATPRLEVPRPEAEFAPDFAHDADAADAQATPVADTTSVITDVEIIDPPLRRLRIATSR